MRLFVSVGVPEVRIEGARLGGPSSPAHLTVLFLGEVPPERAGPIAERFGSAVRGHPPFTLGLAGVGVFPNLERPRVAWIGVQAGARELAELHRRLLEACRAFPLPVDARPFVPHLTLRRLRGPGDVDQARRWVAEFGSTPFGEAVVTELELKESRLGPGPVVHTTQARLPLEGPRPSA